MSVIMYPYQEGREIHNVFLVGFNYSESAIIGRNLLVDSEKELEEICHLRMLSNDRNSVHFTLSTTFWKDEGFRMCQSQLIQR